ncbi:MAG: chromosomal replication initiator protein DnaA [Provencibacterium sp.]|nr:chromosomal replication initiator protein DnaA [Provencibacterium sp.]
MMDSINSFHELFQLVSDYCKGEISEVAYNLWIKDIEPIELKGSSVYLGVKTDFKKKILEERYVKLLEEAFEAVLGFPVEVKILCENPEDTAAPPPPQAESIVPGSGPPEAGDYEYTFSTFIIGPSNKFAHAASLAVATNPASTYNPLFIYGASGLGKTHLLYAICNEIQQNFPQKRLIYVKGEEFTNELINAIQNNTTMAFHDKYRVTDVLLVDDIQFIGGKESTQEEFFHTFNTLYQAGKQIVLTSDRPPKEIKTLEDRLRTRFEWGLLADIQPPDFETRIAIIRRKAQLMGSTMPDDVAEYIANRLKTNIRQLEGAVKKIIAFEQFAHTPPSILMAQNAIRDILNDNQPIPVTVERIISEVSRTYSVSPQDIRSTKRSAQISTARQAAIYVVREITQMSMSAIGEEFGGKDHSTIVYSIQKVEGLMENNPVYKETIEDIIRNIRNS